MNIIAHCITYNESRFIRHYLNHYANICSKIIIHDNESTDDTVQIAKQYSNVEIQTFKTGGKFNEAAMTKLRNNCWKETKDCDYVIVGDADEILYSEYLMDDIEELKYRGTAVPEIAGFNMFSEKFPDDYSSPITAQVKTGVPDSNYAKCIIFDPKAVKEINFTAGSHKCYPVYNYRHKINGSDVEDPVILFLLHYKWLDKEYVRQKHKAYAERFSAHSLKTGYGNHYLQGEEYLQNSWGKFLLLSKQIID